MEGNVFAFCPAVLLSENLDQSRKSNTGFEIVSLPLIDNYSICLIKFCFALG